MSKVDGTLNAVLAQAPPKVYHIDRCRVVHTPAGVGALIPASTVRARYSKIYWTYNRIQSALASDSNEYLPFYRLHDDLMVEIWDYLNVCDRNNVAAVSRRFRSLALNTARLWRFINLDGSLCIPRIETLLKRAGVVPLHIRATDHHLREIRPSLPHTTIPWYLPPPPRFHLHLHMPFIQISHHHRAFTHMSHHHQACFIHNIHPFNPPRSL
jgi:hypothetical protein